VCRRSRRVSTVGGVTSGAQLPLQTLTRDRALGADPRRCYSVDPVVARPRRDVAGGVEPLTQSLTGHRVVEVASGEVGEPIEIGRYLFVELLTVVVHCGTPWEGQSVR
jgi:hypothetical protein